MNDTQNEGCFSQNSNLPSANISPDDKSACFNKEDFNIFLKKQIFTDNFSTDTYDFDKNKDISATFKSLNMENMKLKNENEEKSKRLQIALQLNEELSAKISKYEISNNNNSSNIKFEYMNVRLKKENEQLHEKILDFQNQNQLILNELEKNNTINQEANKQLIQSAEQYFNQKFSDINSLIIFLKSPNPYKDFEFLLHKTEDELKLTRQENEKQKDKILTLEKELSTAQNSFKILEETHKKELENVELKYKMQIEETKSEQQISLIKIHTELATKESTINSLKMINEKLKNQAKEQKGKTDDEKTEKKVAINENQKIMIDKEKTEYINEFQKIISKQQFYIEELETKIDKKDQYLSQLCHKIDVKREKVKLYKKQKKNLINIIEANENSIQSHMKENNNLLTLLDMEKQKNESNSNFITMLQTENSKIQTKICDLEGIINSQKDKIISFSDENDLLSKETSKLKDIIKSLQTEIDNAKNQIASLKEQLAKAQETNDLTDSISQSVFISKEFTQELNHEIIKNIQDINENDKRIQKTLEIIASYYDVRIQKCSKLIDNYKDQLSKYDTNFHFIYSSLLPYLRKVQSINSNIHQYPINKDSNEIPFIQYKDKIDVKKILGDQKESKEFALEIANGFKYIPFYSVCSETLWTICQTLNIKIPTMPSTIISQISDLIEMINKQKKKNQDQEMLISNLKYEKNQINEVNKKQNDESDIQLHSFLKKIESFNIDKAKMMNEIKELQKQLANSHQQYIDLEEQCQNKHQLNESSYQNEIISRDQQITQMMKNYEAQRKDYEAKLKQLKSQNDYNISKIKELKNRIKNSSNKYNEIKQIYQQQVQDNKYLKLLLEKNNNRDKEELNSLGEKLHDSLIELDLQKKKYETCHQSLMSVQSQYHKAQIQINELQCEINNKTSELEKHKNMIQIDAQKAITQAEVSNQQMINTIKTSYEKSIYEIYRKIAYEFREFFDPKLNLDKDSFATIIKVVRNELNRMKKKDEEIRKLLKIAPNEEIEDTIRIILTRNDNPNPCYL